MDKYINQQTLQNALERKQCGPANKRYTEGWNDCLMREEYGECCSYY